MGNADGEMDALTALRAECEQLRAENTHLRSLLTPTAAEAPPAKRRSPPATALTMAAPSALETNGPVARAALGVP